MSEGINNQFDFFKKVNLDEEGNIGVSLIEGEGLLTEEQLETLSHFTYNPITDRLEANKDIEAGDTFYISDVIRLRPSDANSKVPVVEFFNSDIDDWETGTLEVGSGSIKVGGTTLSQHGDTMSITDPSGNRKVIPTLKIDNNLIGDSVTVDVGDVAEFDVDVQPVDNFEYIGNELIFYGLGLANSIVSVLKGLAGTVAPNVSVQVIIYRGWHSSSTILSNPHASSLNKMVQKGIPSSKFGSSSAFDVNLSEAVQFYLNGPYSVLMRTTHKDSSNFSLMGNNTLTNPLTGGTQFVPSISIDRTVQKNIHLFTERDASHLDADVFAVEGLTVDTDLRYGNIQDAVDSCPDNGTVQVVGNFESLVLPTDKNIKIKGVGGASIGSTSYNSSNTHCIYQSDNTSTKEYHIENLNIKNSGGYGVYIKGAGKVTIENCKIFNNGWNGTQLNTVLSSGVSGLLGYDSSSTDLQSFYAGANASNGGAVRIENSIISELIGNEVNNNLRGLRLQDCGINGYGIITRNQIYNNIESGIYLASSSYNASSGCENFTVYNNASKYNANNGVLVIGGINNVVSLNIIEGNWNAGIMGWHVSNTRFRDLDLTNNNRTALNGIGNTGDAHSSITIGGDTARAERGYIASVLSCEIYNTGLGSNTSSVGFQVLQDVENITGGYGINLINIDDSGFHKQDYSIDVLADLNNVKLTIGDCRYIETSETNININNGSYYEQPFSNHITNLKECDFSTDGESVILKEGINGVRLNPYTLHDLQASLNGSEINIILKDSEKIQFNLTANGVSIDGVLLTGTDQEKVNELNAMLQHSGSSSGSAPVITSSLTVSMTEGSTLNYELTSDFGVAYEWDLSLVSGIATVDGHVRKIIGGSNLTAGTYNIPVKAINYNGFDSKTLVLTVTTAPFSNNKSLNFANQDYIGANASLLSSTLGRSGNGSGSSDAWSISLWYKGSTNQQGQTIFYFGDSTTTNGGHIVLHQINLNGVKHLRFRYGHQYNKIQLQTAGITPNTWQHILITYDGGTTGSQSTQINQYYGRFNIFIDGVLKNTANTHSAFGYNGSIPADNLRIGRYSSGNYMRDCRVDEVAIFNSDQSSNISDIYNGGNTFDLLSLTAAPLHWWRMGDGDTYPYLQDNGTANNCIFQMYNMTSADIVSDTP